jgi:hypothetical protein
MERGQIGGVGDHYMRIILRKRKKKSNRRTKKSCNWEVNILCTSTNQIVTHYYSEQIESNRKKRTHTHTQIKARRYKKNHINTFFPEEHHLQDRQFGEYCNCHLHGGDGKRSENSSTSRLSNNSNDVSTIKWNSMTTCRKVREFLTSALTTEEWTWNSPCS